MNALLNAANALSFLRILITPVFVWILLYQPTYLWVGIVLFTIAAITDTCDGYVARRYGLVTELGNFLDPFADKVLVFSTFYSFYALSLIPLWLVLLVIIRDLGITGLRLAMVNRGKSLKTSWLGKWKTTVQIMFIYCLFSLMLVVGKNVAYEFTFVLWCITTTLMYLVAFMTAFSGAHYLVNIVKSK